MAPEASPASRSKILRRHLKKRNIGKMSKMDLLRYLPLINLAKKQMETQLGKLNPYISISDIDHMKEYCEDAGYSAEEARSVVKDVTQAQKDNGQPTSPFYASPSSPYFPDSPFDHPTSPSPTPPTSLHCPESPPWAPSSPNYGGETPPTPLPYDFYLV